MSDHFGAQFGETRRANGAQAPFEGLGNLGSRASGRYHMAAASKAAPNELLSIWLVAQKDMDPPCWASLESLLPPNLGSFAVQDLAIDSRPLSRNSRWKGLRLADVDVLSAAVEVVMHC